MRAACYDEETGAYTAVTKCLSGFNECAALLSLSLPAPLEAELMDVVVRSAFYKEMREKYRPDADNPLTDTSAWPEVEAGCASLPDLAPPLTEAVS